MIGNSNTLKIFFPGIRYSCDRSLLYFLDKYIDGDSIYLEYDLPRNIDVIDDFQEKIKSSVDIAYERLSDIDWSKYGEIILIGKSVGTVVASKVREHFSLVRARFICLTPINETLPFIKQTDFVVTSKQDQYIDITSLIKKQFIYPFLTIYEDLPHSLELPNDYHRTVKVLGEIIDLALNYLDTAYKDLLG